MAWTDRVWTESAITGTAGDVTLDLAVFQTLPEEIRLRLLLRAAAQAGGIQPGLEKAERAVARLHQGGALLTLTLGHALVRQSRTCVRVVREHRNLPFHDWLPGAPRCAPDRSDLHRARRCGSVAAALCLQAARNPRLSAQCGRQAARRCAGARQAPLHGPALKHVSLFWLVHRGNRTI